ncbi:MAG: hypothetical protein ABJF10_03350 [Chthoniobacter sp.]|uniref:hypothetical protein n=1 Tax=Chthoniobacter sp. TaxID=2510640 RepID=UPI0032A8E860
MKRPELHTRFWWVFLLGLLMGSSLSAAEPAAAPKKFSAAIGGFLGPSFSVELTAPDTLTYTHTPRPKGDGLHPERSTVKVAEAQWKKFRTRLDAAKVWTWKTDYTNPAILDGTSWKLAADFGDQKIETSGRNAYPAQAQFDALLAAVEELLGGKTFK